LGARIKYNPVRPDSDGNRGKHLAVVCVHDHEKIGSEGGTSETDK
jgi:hypothetical protein